MGAPERPKPPAVSASWMLWWPPYSWSASICAGDRSGPVSVISVLKRVTPSRYSLRAQRLGDRCGCGSVGGDDSDHQGGGDGDDREQRQHGERADRTVDDADAARPTRPQPPPKREPERET